jgi:hypothetical protein
MKRLPTASAGVDDLNLMERDLLSRVTGDSGRQRLQGQGQDQDPRPPPSPTLSLRVGNDKERQSRAADGTNRGHGHEPQQAQAAAANVVALLPSSSRLPFAPDGCLATVVVPGYPMSERRHNLREAGSGARAQSARTMPVQEQRASPAGLQGSAPQRPPMAPVRCTMELAVAGPTLHAGPTQRPAPAGPLQRPRQGEGAGGVPHLPEREPPSPAEARVGVGGGRGRVPHRRVVGTPEPQVRGLPGQASDGAARAARAPLPLRALLQLGRVPGVPCHRRRMARRGRPSLRTSVSPEILAILPSWEGGFAVLPSLKVASQFYHYETRVQR